MNFSGLVSCAGCYNNNINVLHLALRLATYIMISVEIFFLSIF